MTDTSVYLQPAFILQQHKLRETSLIIDVLTRDFGRISLLAKGVRKAKSKTAGLLQPFVPLLLSYTGKAELKILTDIEIMQPGKGLKSCELKGLTLYCGFYINELVVFFCINMIHIRTFSALTAIAYRVFLQQLLIQLLTTQRSCHRMPPK